MNLDLSSTARIASTVVRLRPNTILQCGMSSGTLGALCRDALDFGQGRESRKSWSLRLDGLAWPKEKHTPLYTSVYDRVMEAAPDRPQRLSGYDVVLCLFPNRFLPSNRVLPWLRDLLDVAKGALVVVTEPEDGEQPGWLAPLASSYSAESVGTDEAPLTVYMIRKVSHVDGAVESVTQGPLPSVQAVDAIWDQPAPPRSRPLNIAYLIPGHQITGGMKMLMEQIRHLRLRGHRIHAVARGLGSTALPPWTDVTADSTKVLAPGQSLADGVKGADVVVVGWIQHLEEAAKLPQPTLYWEQGHEFLFEDEEVATNAEWVSLFDRGMRVPNALAAVSPLVQEIIQKRFSRRAGLVVNGIDSERFFPGERPKCKRVLLIGNAALKFKGFPDAMRVLDYVADRIGRLQVTWVSQVPVEVTSNRFMVNLIVNPPQRDLPQIYRDADVFLSTSHYEAFGMPPLEAMASGVPVVATDNGGIRTYARPGENCLLADVGDLQSLAWGMIQVLTNHEVADYLASEGRKTAEQFSWEAAIDQLEDALYRTATYFPGARPLV